MFREELGENLGKRRNLALRKDLHGSFKNIKTGVGWGEGAPARGVCEDTLPGRGVLEPRSSGCGTCCCHPCGRRASDASAVAWGWKVKL